MRHLPKKLTFKEIGVGLDGNVFPLKALASHHYNFKNLLVIIVGISVGIISSKQRRFDAFCGNKNNSLLVLQDVAIKAFQNCFVK